MEKRMIGLRAMWQVTHYFDLSSQSDETLSTQSVWACILLGFLLKFYKYESRT